MIAVKFWLFWLFGSFLLRNGSTSQGWPSRFWAAAQLAARLVERVERAPSSRSSLCRCRDAERERGVRPMATTSAASRSLRVGCAPAWSPRPDNGGKKQKIGRQ